jgi:hypothetical protein
MYMGAARISSNRWASGSPRGAARKFAYKLAFKNSTTLNN